MELRSPTLSGVTTSSVSTPLSGKVTLFNESVNNHFCQKDSAGKIIDLAAVESQEDSVGFDCTSLWTFETGTESWTVANGTIAFDSSNGKGILVTDTSAVTTTILTSPSGLTIDGTKYRRVKMSLTLVTPGTLPANTPNFQYVTGGHGFSASFRRIIPYPVPFSTANDTVILDFDMENLVDGGTDWQTTNPITQIRVSLTDATTTGMVVRVNWVAVGANRPAQRSIQFKDEGVAVSSAGYIKNVDFTGNVTATASGDTLTVNVPAGAGTGNVTQSANSSASGKLKISAAADDKSITDYSGVSALLKVDGSSVVANAAVGRDYSTLGLQLAAILP